MTRPLLRLPALHTRWRVETSHMVQLPDSYEVLTLEELREQLQQATLKYRARPDKPPLGELTFRYETDNRDRVVAVLAYFTGKDKQLKRFARLRRT